MGAIETVLIAGAGAIGLMVADTFYRHDPRCVSVLAGGERLKRYQEQGLWINNSRVDFSFAEASSDDDAQVLGTDVQKKPFDLIIVASKNHHLDQIIAGIKPYVGQDTIILSLLNGISSEERIGAVYGRERLPLAMIISADPQHRDGKTSFTRRGIVHFGDAGGLDTGRDQRIAEFFTRTGLPFEYHRHDMKRMLWYKWMVNVGVNQTSALFRLPYGAFKQGPHVRPEAREFLESAMNEVILISQAEGINLDKSDIEKWYASMVSMGDTSYTSMCQDVLAGRKTEVELFGLTVMEYGRKHKIPTPVNELLYRAIRAIETARPDGVFIPSVP
jgi:2-dehydropantoate 2-reductase